MGNNTYAALGWTDERLARLKEWVDERMQIICDEVCQGSPLIVSREEAECLWAETEERIRAELKAIGVTPVNLKITPKAFVPRRPGQTRLITHFDVESYSDVPDLFK